MSELLVLLCRPGFEKECAAEICHHGERLSYPGFARTQPRQGYVVFEPYAAEGARTLYTVLPLTQLIFTRQWFVGTAELRELPPADRVGPIAQRLSILAPALSDLRIETPDTNEGKSLARLARRLAPPLRAALAVPGQVSADDGDRPCAHLLLTGGTCAYAGYSLREASSPWPQGIPRLRLPHDAPSRAVLKLEEALHTFLTPAERERWLGEGRTAVDLGAAPGGWTWLLVRKGLQVTAVDNGRLLEDLVHSPQVDHRREDGFTFRPERPVHWLVCDIVEKPRRVAQLAATWYAQGWCERAIFNLKLPMKKRFDEVRHCLRLIEEATADLANTRISARQLYHDREEITVYLAPEPPEP